LGGGYTTIGGAYVGGSGPYTEGGSVGGTGNFLTDLDVRNRALQLCGARRIASPYENSKENRETAFAYGKLRRAELATNVWTKATRRAILRPIDTNTMLLAPAAWVAGTTYFVGSIVADGNNNNWISRAPDNLGNDPTQSPNAWEPYYGPLSVSLWDSTASTAYWAGEVVYTAAGDGTSRVYVSLQSANSDNPATASAWDSTVTYQKNAVVTYSSVAYMSKIDLNLNQTPATSPASWTTTFVGGAGSGKWRQIGGAEFPNGVGLAELGNNILWPYNAGPSSQLNTKNCFLLPNNHLKTCSQDPKAGSLSFLGAPHGLAYRDWLFEGPFLISSESGALLYRFVADVTNVTALDVLFCEGLACRIALEVCESLTNSSTKLADIAKQYETFMGKAKMSNAIEAGAEEPPDDNYVTSRY
jgi:hypothetical protein